MSTKPLRMGLVGAGRIGRNHAEIIARHTPGAELVAIADPAPGVAHQVAAELAVAEAHTSIDQLLESGLDAVVITAATTQHGPLIRAAAQAGVAIFCEKPACTSLEELDETLKIVEKAGVLLQIGFNRRFVPSFREAHELISAGGLGSVQLMRSNTRDPQLNNPGQIPAWTIFTQTLIHDFDTLAWLNPGASPVSVHAQADALIAPEFKDQGLLDTAMVTIVWSNGALSIADASFQAVYGYDVRAEVFGSTGQALMGTARANELSIWGPTGMSARTGRSDTELLQSSYRDEFTAFAEAIRDGKPRGATGSDARVAYTIAEAAIRSMQTGTPVRI